MDTKSYGKDRDLAKLLTAQLMTQMISSGGFSDEVIAGVYEAWIDFMIGKLLMRGTPLELAKQQIVDEIASDFTRRGEWFSDLLFSGAQSDRSH